MAKQPASRNASEDLTSLRNALGPRDLKGTILCFVRDITHSEIEVSFDMGATFERVSSEEISGAEKVKQVVLANAIYDLVRLYTKDYHPTIEIAALSAQVRSQRAYPPRQSCGCSEPQARDGVLHCRDVCAEAHGCDWVNCVFWCAFLRAEQASA
jgi:hypothetical protein